ncbi:MAG: CHAT domain-containing protein [Synechococcales cyanobacterium CRU_2_2]|nr:CHAT domain-containing protein [Synechococcales cyanobacterium CRU_2_2]
MVQEFHLSVTPIEDDRYYVRVERVENGVPLAEEQVTWPVEDWLALARQVFTDPLSEFFQSSPEDPYEVIPVDPLSSDAGSSSEPALVALGQTLHNALFQGTVRDSWVIAQGVAQNRRQPLRLRLGLKAEQLTRLPWEVLHAGNRPIAASTDVIFSRYQGTLNTISGHREPFAAQASLPASLHILMVLAAPTDQANLELKREALQLQEELDSHRMGDSQGVLPDIQLRILEHPGREELTQVLEQAPYQVFHFAGHSSPGPSGGRLHLVNSRSGLTESLNGDDLAGLLANNGIQLAVLNSCLGTQAATSSEFDLQGERTLAEALIRRGIPGVLAMAERIPDQVALTLSRLFYRNLKLGQPLDLSLCRARQGLISAYGSNQLYWALPILYLHSDFGGRLVRPTQEWGDLVPRPEPAEPLPTAMDPMSYRGGSTTLAPPLDANIGIVIDPRDGSLVFPPEDPTMTGMADPFEPDRAGLGWVTPDVHPNPHLTTPDSTTTDLTPLPVSGSGASVVTETQDTRPPGPKPQSPSSIALQKRVGWSIAGVTGLLLLGAGIWGVTQPGKHLTVPGATANRNNPALVGNNRTMDEWRNEAIAGASTGDSERVIQALDKLLDKDDLAGATTAVNALNASLLEKATEAQRQELAFLRGRLNWQQFSRVQAIALSPELTDSGQASDDLAPRNTDIYSDGARLQWLTLTELSPDNLRYRSAYGLTLLAKADQKNLLTAQALLKESLEQIAQTQTQDEEKLETYATLALVYTKLAQSRQAGQNAELWKEATELYKVVIKADAAYSPESLNQNFDRFWMWTPTMIQDWVALGKVAGGDREAIQVR